MRRMYADMDRGTPNFVAEQVREYLGKRTLIIIYWDAEEKRHKVGTGTIIQRDEKKYVMTCEHVATAAMNDPRSIVKGQEWAKSVPFASLIPVFSSERLDFAVLQYTRPSNVWIDWEQLAAVPSRPKNLGMLLWGFPADQVTPLKPYKFDAKPWSYWTARSETKIVGLKRHQFLLEYDRDLNNTNTGTKLPKVPGMSGSLVVVPRYWKPGKIWTPGEFDVVGIETAWWESKSVMYATRGDTMRKAWK
jgi:hypothetical protein